ncbi:Presequence protease 1 [Nymphaea thermarum]|nr:Presequence protease 1 [Nymphaea thermarum]
MVHRLQCSKQPARAVNVVWPCGPCSATVVGHRGGESGNHEIFYGCGPAALLALLLTAPLPLSKPSPQSKPSPPIGAPLLPSKTSPLSKPSPQSKASYRCSSPSVKDLSSVEALRILLHPLGEALSFSLSFFSSSFALRVVGRSSGRPILVYRYNFRSKCIYIAVMLRRMMEAVLNPEAIDDKDYVGNKRLELSGYMISQQVQFTDQQRFKQFVSQSKARMENRLRGSGHGIAASRMDAKLNVAGWISEQMGGISLRRNYAFDLIGYPMASQKSVVIPVKVERPKLANGSYDQLIPHSNSSNLADDNYDGTLDGNLANDGQIANGSYGKLNFNPSKRINDKSDNDGKFILHSNGCNHDMPKSNVSNNYNNGKLNHKSCIVHDHQNLVHDCQPEMVGGAIKQNPPTIA